MSKKNNRSIIARRHAHDLKRKQPSAQLNLCCSCPAVDGAAATVYASLHSPARVILIASAVFMSRHLLHPAVEKEAQEKLRKKQEKAERKKTRQLAATGEVRKKRKGLRLRKGVKVKVSGLSSIVIISSATAAYEPGVRPEHRLDPCTTPKSFHVRICKYLVSCCC